MALIRRGSSSLFGPLPKSTCHPSTMSFHPGVHLQIRAHHETSSWLGFQPKVPGAARWPAYTYRSGKDVIAPKNGSRKLELLVFLQSKKLLITHYYYYYFINKILIEIIINRNTRYNRIHEIHILFIDYMYNEIRPLSRVQHTKKTHNTQRTPTLTHMSQLTPVC